MTSKGTAPHALAGDLELTRAHRLVIMALVAGICLPLLDTTIVGVAIPDLASYLNAPLSRLQWVSTSYTLAAACAVPVCAWATRRFGGRTLWIVGLLLFAAGSVAAACANTVWQLIVFRILQGAGAGIMMPVMQSILVNATGHARLKTAMATAAVPAVLAPIAGPVIGGFLLHFGPWQLIFWINLPITFLAIGLAFRFLARDDGNRGERFDTVGFLLLLPALGLMIWGFADIATMTARFGQAASPMMAVGAGLAGLAFAAGFVRHIRLRAKDPLLDIRLFTVCSFRDSMGLLFLASLIFYGGIFLLPLFLITSGGQSPMIAAILVGVHGLGALLSRRYLTAATRRYGTGNIALMAAIGAGIGTAALFTVEISPFPVSIGIVMLVRGAGVGLLTLLAMSHAYHDVERHKIADASALSRVVTLLGASVGTALVAVLHQISTALGWDAFRLALVGLFLMAALCTLPAMALKRADR